MLIKQILNDTTAIICGRLDSKENTIEKMYGVMEYNKSVLKECHSVVLVFNRGTDTTENDMSELYNFYKKEFPITFLLQPHPVGMGHQIGHVTLDKTGYLFSKNNLKTKYTMKLVNDILLDNKFLDVEVEDSDLYFIPSVGANEMIGKWSEMLDESKLSVGYKNILYNYQTWFYIASNQTPYIYESDEEIERLFRLWDYKNDVRQEKLLCAEHSLVKWSISNNLRRSSLYNKNQLENYRQFVLQNRIFDGSLKNITIEHLGITHCHFKDAPITVMTL